MHEVTKQQISNDRINISVDLAKAHLLIRKAKTETAILVDYQLTKSPQSPPSLILKGRKLDRMS